MNHKTIPPRSTTTTAAEHKTAVRHLRRARCALVHFGWRQGDTKVGHESADGICLGSAVAQAFGLVVTGDCGTNMWDSFTAVGRDAARTFHREDYALPLPGPLLLVQRWLYRAAETLPDLDPQLPPDVFMDGDGSVHDNLRHWNDDPNRTLDDVLALVDAALELALRDSSSKRHE